MDERPEAEDPVPARGARRRTLGLVAVALGLALGIPAALLAASTACACSTSAALVVLNYSHEEVPVSWEAQGPLGLPLFGKSGQAVVAACSTLPVHVGSGSASFTVRLAGETRTVARSVGASSGPATFVVPADGPLTGPTAGAPSGEYPQDPLCN